MCGLQCSLAGKYPSAFQSSCRYRAGLHQYTIGLCNQYPSLLWRLRIAYTQTAQADDFGGAISLVIDTVTKVEGYTMDMFLPNKYNVKNPPLLSYQRKTDFYLHLQ